MDKEVGSCPFGIDRQLGPDAAGDISFTREGCRQNDCQLWTVCVPDEEGADAFEDCAFVVAAKSVSFLESIATSLYVIAKCLEAKQGLSEMIAFDPIKTMENLQRFIDEIYMKKGGGKGGA